MLNHDPAIELHPPLGIVERDPFIDGLEAGTDHVPPPAHGAPKRGRSEMKKKRIIVLNDEYTPALVLELEDGLKFARENFDLASETGDAEAESMHQERIRLLQAILSAVGPIDCPYCDDNQGRTDGRGCQGCNVLSADDNDWSQPVDLSAGSLFVDRDAQMGYLPPHD